MIIDATDLILGRMGTVVAKKALMGEKIDVVNCEKAVVTGKKEMVFDAYKKKYARGIPRKGPFHHRMPDKLVKRSFRGMVPYKQERGRKAYDNIKCHVGVPESLKDQKLDTIKEANKSKLTTSNYVTVLDICKQFGVRL